MIRPLHPLLRACGLLGAGLLAAPWLPAITPAELSARLARRENILVIDARPAQAFAEGHIPGALNIPLALLPRKPLPADAICIVYTDGLGAVSEREALAALRSRPGVTADILVGGYVAWVAETRLSTRQAGVAREKLPGITYQQLLAADKEEIVLLDLRAAPATSDVPAPSTIAGRRVAAAASPDALSAFATKLGVPVVAAAPVAEAAMPAEGGAQASAGAPPRRAALPVGEGDKNARLFVLVAENETAASEVARQLRASGHHRFTILIGGMEIIRHEGRTGSGRLDGGAPARQK